MVGEGAEWLDPTKDPTASAAAATSIAAMDFDFTARFI
jgi:hypothetical protein